MASLPPLKFAVVPPKLKHTATVFFIHGLGDSGAGWVPVARWLQHANPELGHIKWVLPHARKNPVTINFGMEMPSWYDIASLDDVDSRSEDERGMLTSVQSLNDLIKAELDSTPGVDASRCVLGGFSQGAAMTFLTGLTTDRKLAGLSVLSGYLPFRDKMKDMLSAHAKELPIFMAHGSADPVVAFKFGYGSYLYLKDQLGFSTVESGKTAGPGIRFERYEGLGHSSADEELDHFAAWLKAVVPP